MSNIDIIRGLESVHRIKAIESTYEVREEKQDIVYLRKKALLLQRNAVLTGDWTYYAQLLDIQDRIRCHKEILEKYPYDGKSTFAECLEKAANIFKFFINNFYLYYYFTLLFKSEISKTHFISITLSQF